MRKSLFFGTVLAAQLVIGNAAADTGDQSPAAMIARGDYLVNVVVECNACHTPKVRGKPDPSRHLMGWNCFVRGKLPDGSTLPVGSNATGFDGGAGPWCGPGCEPDYSHFGCLSPSNLTNHETGLKNYSDAQIKEMVAHGRRPSGEAIGPIMGYWAYGHLDDYDLDTIVAYLRTVPGIENRVPPSEWPWPPPAPARLVRDEKIWKPAPGTPNYESVMRGRYLATVACLECHSPYKAGLFVGEPFGDTPVDEDRLFSGIGFPWSSELNKIPSPPFPKRIYSQNLTQDPETGIKGWSTADITRAVRDGIAKDGTNVCPPMPTGLLPGGAGHGRLHDDDMRDIAAYILALPPIVNQRPTNCHAPNILAWALGIGGALLAVIAGIVTLIVRWRRRRRRRRLAAAGAAVSTTDVPTTKES